MTLNRSRACALSVGLLVLLAACGNEGEAPRDAVGRGPAGADGTAYVVTGVTVAGERQDLVPGSEIRLAFADGSLRITAGCNTMSGDYELVGTRLSVAPLAMTEMGCAPRLMEQDAWVAGLFERPVQLATGDDASLISGDTVLSLTDREVASPDLPLAGTTWVLDSIGTGTGPDGAVSSVPAEWGAELEVRADHSFSYFWGCGSNDGGTVAIEDGTATWTVEVSGIADCVEHVEGSEEAEEALKAVIHGRTGFSIDEDRLTITRGDRTLGFVAKS